MDLSTFIYVFCLIDDRLKVYPSARSCPEALRRQNPVLTIGIVGQLLDLDTDKAIFRYFKCHYGEWFPAPGWLHRTTFRRQSANLWKVKEDLC